MAAMLMLVLLANFVFVPVRGGSMRLRWFAALVLGAGFGFVAGSGPGFGSSRSASAFVLLVLLVRSQRRLAIRDRHCYVWRPCAGGVWFL